MLETKKINIEYVDAQDVQQAIRNGILEAIKSDQRIKEQIVRFLAKHTPENECMVRLPIQPSTPRVFSNELTLEDFEAHFQTVDFYPRRTTTGFFWEKFIFDGVEYDVIKFLRANYQTSTVGSAFWL